jgi:hypothetical protein
VVKQIRMTTISVPFYKYLTMKLDVLLKKIAKQRRLLLSNQDSFSGNIIALDSNKKELIYLNPQRQNSCTIISLQQLSKCSVTKYYHSISAGELAKNKLQSFLKSMFLNLQFNDGSASVALPIYQVQQNTTIDVEKLEVKAKKWQDIICSVLPRTNLERA